MTSDLGKLPAWLDTEDLGQAIALARLQAERLGFDPAAAEAEAIRDHVRAARRGSPREIPATDYRRSTAGPGPDRSRLAWVAEASKVLGLRPARDMTPGQRRRFLRNQVIFAARLANFPQESLAVVFGLPQSRISAIEKEMGEKIGPA